LEASLLHDVVRFGDAAAVADRLAAVTSLAEGALVTAYARHAAAASAGDPAGLGAAAAMFEQCGALLLAAEAAAEQADAVAQQADRKAAADARREVARLRAAVPGVTTPLLDGSVTLAVP
jgi:hypothetical protein